MRRKAEARRRAAAERYEQAQQRKAEREERDREAARRANSILASVTLEKPNTGKLDAF